MMIYTYKHIVISIATLFIVTMVLFLIAHDYSQWYVCVIPCILTWFILKSRANKLVLCENGFLIKSLFGKKLFEYGHIRKVKVFADSFFYVKTIGMVVYSCRGNHQTFYIGTLLFSQAGALVESLDMRTDIKIEEGVSEDGCHAGMD